MDHALRATRHLPLPSPLLNLYVVDHPVGSAVVRLSVRRVKPSTFKEHRQVVNVNNPVDRRWHRHLHLDLNLTRASRLSGDAQWRRIRIPLSSILTSSMGVAVPCKRRPAGSSGSPAQAHPLLIRRSLCAAAGGADPRLFGGDPEGIAGGIAGARWLAHDGRVMTRMWPGRGEGGRNEI